MDKFVVDKIGLNSDNPTDRQTDRQGYPLSVVAA